MCSLGYNKKVCNKYQPKFNYPNHRISTRICIIYYPILYLGSFSQRVWLTINFYFCFTVDIHIPRMEDRKRDISMLVDHFFRHESGKMVSVLTKIFGSQNLDLAEDVVQDSLIEAMEH